MIPQSYDLLRLRIEDIARQLREQHLPPVLTRDDFWCVCVWCGVCGHVCVWGRVCGGRVCVWACGVLGASFMGVWACVLVVTVWVLLAQ